MTKTPTVSIVIPAWNSASQLEQNLPAVITAAAKVQAEIIIVDDHSTLDQTVVYLTSLRDQIRLIQNTQNLGFAATVNRGVKLALGDLIVLLNTDVRPDPNCFVQALKYFKGDSVYALGFNSGEDWMGGEWERGLFHHFRVKATSTGKNQVSPSLWASGGQGAFSRQKWIELGGMDALYEPFYWEDTDMGYRAWKRGWKILWARECRVAHDHASSVIAGNYSKSFVKSTAARNQFLFVWKNISDYGYLMRHLFFLPLYLLRYPGPVFRALLRLPQVLRRRRSESRFWKRSDHDILALWAR